MFGNPIHHVYIADGFMDDVEELIQKCLQRQDVIDFQSFCIVWKEMDIGCLYNGRTSAAEVAELSEEVLQIAKHYMLANTSNYEESVAGLFLVYSLLNTQPYPGFAALRLVPEDVTAISRLETVARRERRHDVLYILASVLIKGPCQYHAAERERGLEAPIKKYLDGFKSIDSIRGVRPKGVFYRQNEELDIIRELGNLTKRYSEAKEAVDGATSDRSLQYINEELPFELNTSLRRIISGGADEEEDENVSDDVDDRDREDHHALVESIKSRAMKDAVNPMKHLVGVEDRKRQAKPNQKQQKIKSDIKSKPGKLKRSSPTKPHNSPNKRRPSPKGNKGKRTKANTEKGGNNAETSGNKDIEMNESRMEILPEGTELPDDDVVECTDEGSGNVAISSLPPLRRTGNIGPTVVIEVLDECGKKAKGKGKGQGKRVVANRQSGLPDLDALFPAETSNAHGECSTSTHVEEYDLTADDEGKKKTNDRPRKLKKTHLKSKFKRMGMLPVANFGEPQNQ
ncbi:unnamed protein product, partial [Iphiclides podalirius]